jgi:ribosomal protein L39E
VLFKPIKPLKIPKTEKEIMKTYYEKSKDKIAKQQKEYRQNRNIPAYRIKLVRKLNNDKDYINKTTKAILDKYNIKQGEDGIYY